MHLTGTPEQFLSFNAAMLAAVRADRKTVTRRRITQSPLLLATPDNYHLQAVTGSDAFFSAVADGQPERVTNPFGRPGDYLRVTEAPEIRLKIVGVRAERVQAISEEQALAEGIGPYALPSGAVGYGVGPASNLVGSAVAAFQALITTIYPAAWTRNEWVWVLEFRRMA